ncbi:MAG: transposase [Verrucomicrobiia bacterium]
MDLPQRQHLPHTPPPRVDSSAIFFITVCCTPRDTNQLCHPDIAARLFETVAHRHDNQVWHARLFLLMPDHLHALLSFSPGKPMSKVVAQWKEYVAKATGVRWQRDFFDHRLRSDEQWQVKAAYIELNPVRNGLVREAKDWPYVWRPEQSKVVSARPAVAPYRAGTP